MVRVVPESVIVPTMMVDSLVSMMVMKTGSVLEGLAPLAGLAEVVVSTLEAAAVSDSETVIVDIISSSPRTEESRGSGTGQPPLAHGSTGQHIETPVGGQIQTSQSFGQLPNCRSRTSICMFREESSFPLNIELKPVERENEQTRHEKFVPFETGRLMNEMEMAGSGGPPPQKINVTSLLSNKSVDGWNNTVRVEKCKSEKVRGEKREERERRVVGNVITNIGCSASRFRPQNPDRQLNQRLGQLAAVPALSGSHFISGF